MIWTERIINLFWWHINNSSVFWYIIYSIFPYHSPATTSKLAVMMFSLVLFYKYVVYYHVSVKSLNKARLLLSAWLPRFPLGKVSYLYVLNWSEDFFATHFALIVLLHYQWTQKAWWIRSTYSTVCSMHSRMKKLHYKRKAKDYTPSSTCSAWNTTESQMNQLLYAKKIKTFKIPLAS